MSILRIIPVKSLQEIWNFPAIYTNAEVSLVTVAGGYVIESPSMEGNDFLDYISTYNFDHNEEKENQLKEKLFNNEVLSFHYKNAKNEKCYWYYSVFEYWLTHSPSVISDSGGISRSFSFPDPGYTCGSRLRWYRTRS